MTMTFEDAQMDLELMAQPDQYASTEGPMSPGDDGEFLTADEILQAVSDEILAASSAINYDKVDEAIDYYNAELPLPKETETEDKFNSYVSPEVMNAVESTLAEIMPGFYGDSPVTFTPMGPGEEQACHNETRIVHHVVMKANPGFTILARAFKDALISRDGIVQVSWDQSVKVSGQRLRGVTEDMLMELGDKVVSGKMEPDGSYTVDIIEREEQGRPLIEWVPKEELLINPDHQDVTLDTARFVCRRRQVTASDLISWGVPKDTVDDLDDSNTYTSLSYEEETYPGLSTYEPGHESTRPIVVAESYYMIDVDGDGIAERRYIVTAGGSNGDKELLFEEPVRDQPFAHGVAFFAARGWSGISMKDRLSGIQDTKSELTRQILDVGWRNLQQRVMAVERMVNMDDLLASKKGGVVRVKDINAVVALNEVQLPQQSLMLLEVLDKTRRESGGGSIDSAPQAQEMGADSAHGVERIMSAVEETGAMVAKTLAETLVSEVYRKTHALLRRYWPGVIATKQGGTWLQATPAEWAERNSVSVVVGLSAGTRMRYAQSLANIIQQQSADVAAGMDSVLLTSVNQYNSRIDYCRLVGVEYPEKYYMDPGSQEGQQMAQQKQQSMTEQQNKVDQQAAAVEMLKAKTLTDIEQIKGQSSMQVAMIKDAIERYKADLAHLEATIDQRLKLMELNAKFDDEEVPDSLAG